MTWKTLSVAFMVCDDRDHLGDPVFKVESGAGETANSALIKAGWHYSSADNRHICPTCAKRPGRR